LDHVDAALDQQADATWRQACAALSRWCSAGGGDEEMLRCVRALHPSDLRHNERAHASELDTCKARAQCSVEWTRAQRRVCHSYARAYWVGGTPTQTPSGDDPFGGSHRAASLAWLLGHASAWSQPMRFAQAAHMSAAPASADVARASLPHHTLWGKPR
jgi:hypothetical protein